MTLSIVAFLPCRRGSQRIKQKNTKSFAGIQGGLTKIKLKQLLGALEISEIVVSTDDAQVMEICHDLEKAYDKPIRLIERPGHLATSMTSTDELISYIPEIIPEGTILWTHVTSPFIEAHIYDQAIKTFHKEIASGFYDSLMSVTKIQKFLWNKDGPINYDKAQEKWPRTQTLSPLYEVNSGFFIASVETYIKKQDRIGQNVYLFELTASQAIDIDWEEDFDIAEAYWQYGQQKENKWI
jgi:CMP-N-acetylneuraminic acid synthetase